MGRPTSSKAGTAPAGRGTVRVPGPTNPSGSSPAPPEFLARFLSLRGVHLSIDDTRVLDKKRDQWLKILSGEITSAHLREQREERLHETLDAEPMLHPDLAGMESPFYDYFYPEEGEPESDPLSLPFSDALGTLLQIYDRLCQYEYGRISEDLWPAFEGMSKEFHISPPWRYYQTLRPGYRKANPTDPIEPINQVVPNVEFLAKKVWLGAHPELVVRLQRVESWLREKGVYDEVKSSLKQPHLGGFVPRLIAGTSDLSNHGLGRAIDIDATTNPMLHGDGGRTIDAILDYLDSKGTKCAGRIRTSFAGFAELSMESFQRMQEISSVMVSFLETWVPKWEENRRLLNELPGQIRQDEQSTSQSEAAAAQERQRLAEAEAERTKNEQVYLLLEKLFAAWTIPKQPGSGLKQAKFYMAQGLISLHPKLFQAMRECGIESGLEWHSKKDTMHFEVPPPRNASKGK